MKAKIIVLIGIICLLSVCGCKQNMLAESNVGTEKDIYLEQEEQDTGLSNNEVYKEKDKQTEENCVHTSNVYGVWEIIEYIGRGIDSHADDIYEENMQTDWDVYREEREGLVGQRIEIEPDELEYCLPSGEREGESFVNSYEGMFLGYKPPIEMEVKYPVERFYIKWKEDETSVYIILDSEGTAVVDIKGDFYYIKPIEGIWEKEFYHCADTLKEAIENMDASDVKLPEYDEYVRQRRRQTYLEVWQDYMDFVESWIANDGGTQEEKEEIYRMATLLMVLIDDNHGASYKFYDANKVYYDFFYDHEQSREELLCAGNQALNRENPIDSGFEQMEEEFESTDYHGERYSLTEAAWEREFYYCMELMRSMVEEQPEGLEELVGSSDTLDAWEIFVEQWAEWNEEYATIEVESGLSIEIALRRKESYRTATLLMIYWLEQYSGEYTFIYDIEKDWERMIEICEK